MLSCSSITESDCYYHFSSFDLIVAESYTVDKSCFERNRKIVLGALKEYLVNPEIVKNTREEGMEAGSILHNAGKTGCLIHFERQATYALLHDGRGE